jgi:spore germination protein GerM
MRRPSLFAGLGIAVAIAAAWILLVVLPRWYGPRAAQPVAAPAAAQQESARKITATLFYVSEDGLRLVPAKREVPFGASTAEQARRILEGALEPAPAPYVNAVPQGTRLRAVFVTGRGEAYVDLSHEVARNHTGGSLDELLTVYAVVNALTVNLPAITTVQILVDGKEVDTLAGHVDLRRPLGQSLRWTEPDREETNAEKR